MVTLKRLLLVWLLLPSALLAGATSAESESQAVSTILSIEVSGNRYVEKEMVVSKMGTKVGDELNRKQLSRDVRALHKSGFFSDVRFTGSKTEKGIHLVCHVKEYPFIASVEIEGNDEHATKDMQLKMKLRPGRIFSPSNQRSDLNTIRKGYLKDGFYQVSVEFMATPRKDGRVDLLVKVNEGEVTTVRRINFIGNSLFDDELRGEIASRESSFMSWISDRDVFDQERFGADSQLLSQFYLNSGYLDFQVESMQLNMAPNKEYFNLTLSLSEGEQYRVSEVAVQGDTVPSAKELQELIELKVGDIYVLSDMRETIDAMTARVGDEGYAFATVTPLMKRNIKDNTVAITFDIEKGDEVYVERIEISGNKKTSDEVIRRQISQTEGARYSGSKVKQGRVSLQRSAFVEDVRLSFPRSDSSDGKVDVKVDITEKSTGSFTAGAGYSQLEKVTLTAGVKEENAFGKGYRTNVDLSIGSVTKNYNIDLYDPYFLGEKMGASLNFFKTQTDQLEQTSYTVDNIGGSVGVNLPLSEHSSYAVAYKYQRTNLATNNVATVSLMLQSQLGRQTTGELTQALNWDNRDRTMGATEGHLEQLTVSVAGLGGSNRFYEASFNSKHYFAFGEDRDVVLNPSFALGKISGYSGRAVPLYRRYSLGGVGTIRGFDAYGISLRDPVTNDAVGGDKKIMGSLNVFFPLPYMQTEGFRGVAYVDAGAVWGNAASVGVSEKFSTSAIRVSAGLGVEWVSPIGPISIAWGLPLRKRVGDIERSFEFAIGTQF